MPVAYLIAVLIVAYILWRMVLGVLGWLFGPAVLEWVNDRVHIVPTHEQPVQTWRWLNRVWFVGIVILMAALIGSGASWQGLLLGLAGLAFFGYGAFLPIAAKRHARNLQSLRDGHCAWCEHSFGRERPNACPACRRELDYGRPKRRRPA